MSLTYRFALFLGNIMTVTAITFVRIILIVLLSVSFSIRALGSSSSISTATTPVAEQGLIAFSKYVEQYQRQIEQLESSKGAYGEGIAQELISLGIIYQQKNKHQQAIKYFKRALHLQRINDGLYSLTMEPILEKLIISLSAHKKWDLVASRLSYLNWLYQRNYDENDIETFAIKMKMARWHLKSFSLKRLEEPVIDILESYFAYQQALKIAESQYGKYDLRTVEPLQGFLLANYLLATSAIKDQAIQIKNRQDLSKPVSTFASKFNLLQNKSLRVGIELIEQEMAAYQHQELVDHVQITKVKLKLADWHLMYGKRERAASLYQQAYHYLAEHSDDASLVKQTFAQPVMLPHFPNVNKKTTIIASHSDLVTEGRFIHASMDITRYGAARNIKVVNVNPNDNSMRYKVVRSLRKAMFRPKIDNGDLSATEQLELQVFQ